MSVFVDIDLPGIDIEKNIEEDLLEDINEKLEDKEVYDLNKLKRSIGTYLIKYKSQDSEVTSVQGSLVFCVETVNGEDLESDQFEGVTIEN